MTLAVMISSTRKDLAQHRQQAIEAVQSVGMFPLPMEHLPADPDDAATVSVRMVDDADVYVGIFAHRYGYVPKGAECSITEMEYNRAAERRLPCLIYFAHEDYLLKARDVEQGTGALKLEQLKQRIAATHVVSFFKSPEDLRARMIHGLATLRDRLGRRAAGSLPEPENKPALQPNYLSSLARYVAQKLRASNIVDFDRDYLPRTLRMASLADRGEELTWRMLVEAHAGVILRASAGAGKSTACFAFIREALDWPARGDWPFVPILIECRKVNSRLSSAAARGEVATDEAAVMTALRQGVLDDLGAPFSASGDAPMMIGCLRRGLEEVNLILVVEGFDELIAGAAPDRPLMEMFAEALESVFNELHPLSLPTVISSREHEAALLGMFRFPVVELAPFTPAEVARFLAARKGVDANWVAELTRVFLEQLAGRPLYLQPLVQHFADLRHEKIDRVALLAAEVQEQLADNRPRCPRDLHGMLQRECMRRLAFEDLRRGTLGRGIVHDVIREVTDDPTIAAQLETVVPLFLESEPGPVVEPPVYKFPHLDFRDYWMADWVVDGLLGRGVDAAQLVEAMTIVRVFENACQMIQGRTPVERADIRDRLIELINVADDSYPPRRRVPTVAAVALSLLTRFEDIGLLGTLNCRKRCFQGFLGASQRIENVCFDWASFRDSDLRGAVFANCQFTGADFDNADLHGTTFERADLSGAVMKNTGMGRYIVCTDSPDVRPTVFLNTRLAGSNWFNFRITLMGYFQFWTAKLIPNTSLICLSTSQGELWVFDLAAVAADPRRLETGHGADIMDFDVQPETGLVVTASRDQTVRFFRVDPEWKTLAPLGVVEGFSRPPRNVAVSRSGRWVGVTDRSSNVFFYPTDRLDRPRASDSSCRALHTGPVLSLAAHQDGNRDSFFTSGYDGRVAQHTGPIQPGSQWWSRELFVLTAPGRPTAPDTIRVLAPWSTDRYRGLWIGGEGCRLYFAPFADVGVHPTRAEFVQAFGAEIFRLGDSPDRETIAIGLADGTIEVHRVVVGDDLPRLELVEVISTQRRDIVRFVEFLDADRIACVYWAGGLRVWSRQERVFVYAYEYPESDWCPTRDADVLQVSPKTEIDGILHISGTFKKYLRLIPL